MVTKDSIESVWNSSDITELRRALSSGEKPAACHHCWHKENLGLTSHRQNMIQEQQRGHRGLSGLLAGDTVASPEPTSITVRFGNVCNLKCRICGPNASSKWVDEHNHYYSEDWTGDKVRYHASFGNNIGRSHVTNWPNDNQRFWDEFRTMLPHLQDVMFSGGEPFMVPKQRAMLTECALSNHAAHIDINFHTNGTLLDDELLTDILPRFRTVTMIFSIDGTGAQFEYMRHPSDWSVVDRNLRRCVSAWNSPGGPQGNIAVNCTVSAMNVLYLHDYGRYFDDIGITAGLNHLHGGPGMKYTYLPAQIRRVIADHLARKQQRQPVSSYQWGISYDEVVHSLRLPPAGADGETTDWFVKATRRMDNYRGEDFAAVFPEMADLVGYRKHLD